LKHLALFVIGHSPAILTETLAACQNDPPDEIRVCSTATGAELLSRTMFAEGVWESFKKAYPVYAETRFSDDYIIAPEGLDDIRSDADNRIISQTIFSMVRSGVERSDKISASIAGGRKTMGYLMGFAMSLFGRPQDRLTHV